MMSLGQPDVIRLTPRKEMQLIFSIKEITKISSNEKPCVANNDYSFTQCLFDYASKKTNCTIDIKRKSNADVFSCLNDEFQRYSKLLVELKRGKISKVKRDSGCYPKCSYSKYSYELAEQTMDWNSNWTSEVYIQAKSSEVEYLIEYRNFDANDLISSIGGNLGLFLGWSLLSLVEAMSILFLLVNFRKCLTFLVK